MEECYFQFSTPPWVFFTFFKLFKWYQITQRTTYETALKVMVFCTIGLTNTMTFYMPQGRVRLKIKCKFISCRLYWLELQHSWQRGNIRYTTLEPPNLVLLFESTDNAPYKKVHLRLINPICSSPLQLKSHCM